MKNFATANNARAGTSLSVATTTLSDANYSPVSADSSLIYPVTSQDYIYNYALNHPNVTRWAVTFDTVTTPYLNVRYQVWYNASLSANGSDIFGRELVSVVRGLDEAIITHLNGNTKTANLDYQLKDWPLIPAVTLSDTIVQSLGSCFFFCSVMVIFISVLNQIVGEKEAHLRHGMEMMGLYPSVYWISNYLSVSVLVLVNSLLTVLFGLAFQFEAFKNANFLAMWITFFLFGESMVMLAFMLTCFVRQARAAVLLGIFIFVIGLLFESFVFSSGQLGYIWWVPTLIPNFVPGILALIPFFNFGRMFLDISTFTTGRLDQLTSTYIPGPGFPWSNLYNPVPQNLLPNYQADGYPQLPNPVQAWNYMIMDVAVYAVLTWYFDAIIPDEYGTAQPFYFPFLPSYWGYEKVRGEMDVKDWVLKNGAVGKGDLPIGKEEEDVAVERQKALSADDDSAVKIVRLRKTYQKSPFWTSSLDKHAVRNSSFTLAEGKLLALLGQNGAGKSTTMSMLAGLTPPTSGDALICGLSVRTQMSQIRRMLGVCPQHDILFEDLTAREHIELYAGLKGVPKSEWGVLFEERLKAVKLWTVKDVRAGTYSGGMKRRLSLVIATIGDPRVIFMDEPTTGMDPVNRRHVWSFIEKFKKDRVIILTTHSMEEADVLGDRIAIMAHGQLCAIGNSISLKNKFGAGYRISVITSNPEAMKAKVASSVPNANLEDDSAGALIYQFPISSTPSIPSFVKWLEENKEGMVKSWGISQTTLEEVFLKL
ncbi:P-loop containing nucleoside triphosphate hydrolase protein [Rhizoclosmatium globosum]|uniref:p-loop containing nucleoside triphosphate hydrolase protein n=1 Tax=Rhizoclosmatium globosum TaxID=329046 RepID=A0A1Y2BMQ6_9FUNG|nr:P-loop containing nucleoside triphosphate hydrolase protein [Rhizoclosmatium globosum]|eukprot:ORY36002.1 P-loop containing nucleoside triphosphate hydrolase protein [Rhizoclosmatium globosum]